LRVVYTLGYDRRSFSEFVEILKRYGILCVVDVRRWVKSTRLPEYSGEYLARVLPGFGVDYYWIPELGGYRKFGVDVEDAGVATCFKSPGFRAYATYITMNPAVKPYLNQLLHLVSEKTCVLLCREKFPWMCHRKILADYLVVKGFSVVHIIDIDRTAVHKLHDCARVVSGELEYS